MTLNIGITEDKRVEIAKGLSQLLAETYTLYLKTHKYHWNVTGPMFQTLHVMFEEHYNALSLAVDEIAERVRVMGVKAPGSYKEFSELSQVKEDATQDIQNGQGEDCRCRSAALHQSRIPLGNYSRIGTFCPKKRMHDD